MNFHRETNASILPGFEFIEDICRSSVAFHEAVRTGRRRTGVGVERDHGYEAMHVEFRIMSPRLIPTSDQARLTSSNCVLGRHGIIGAIFRPPTRGPNTNLFVQLL